MIKYDLYDLCVLAAMTYCLLEPRCFAVYVLQYMLNVQSVIIFRRGAEDLVTDSISVNGSRIQFPYYSQQPAPSAIQTAPS